MTAPKGSTLQKGLRILEALGSSAHGHTAQELANIVGLHKTNVYHYLTVLQAARYVLRDEKGRFYLGYKVLELGGKLLQRMPLRETAHAHLLRLSHRTSKTIHLSVLEGPEVLYIDKIEGPNTLPIRSRVGTRAPAHCTASGKVLLAHLQSEEQRRILSNLTLERRTPSTIVDREQLMEQLRRSVEHGYAATTGREHRVRQIEMTVCGAGAAGTAIAADLALKGLSVTLYELPAFESGIEEIHSRGGIELTADSRSTAGKTGFASLKRTTIDASEAAEDAEVLMITCPALHHEVFMEQLLPHLHVGQLVLFNTGYWGSFRFQRRLNDAGLGKDVTLCETNIMPYLSKRVGPHETKIFNAKRVMTVAAFPGNRTKRAFSVLSTAYQEYKAVPNVLWTNISSGGNPCIHVQLTLPIMGYVFDRFQGCKFYTEATEQFSRLSAAFDRERTPLAEALGCAPIETGPEWAEHAYGYTGRDIADAFRKSPHADRYSPMAVLDRVLDEDIGYAFVPMTRLADQLGHDMPVTKGMIEVCGVMLNKDYWGLGLDPGDLGLEGMTAAEVVRYANTGER